jgi:hypothetical protein
MFGSALMRSDFERCDVAFFLGKNPWHSHSIPRARVTLKEIARDPARTLIVVDPRRTETAELADIHLQVRPGTDAHLMAALLGVLVTEELVDRSFLAAHAAGVEPVLAALRAVPIAASCERAGVAEELVRRTGEPVAILDVDYHHGNGTQQIFYARGDVLYVSLHGDPDRAYPYFAGFEDEIGSGPGEGTTMNLPLPAGTADEAYLEALERALEAIAGFGGSVVVVSLGFDTYGQDPIADFALTTPVYHEVGRQVAALGRRLVILQEGGYFVPHLGENARAWLRGVEGRDLVLTDRVPVNRWPAEV